MTARAERLLVVDDNPAGRYVLARTLRSGGFTVDEIATGREAIAAARNGPSVVVLDVNLPDVNGFDVLRALKADAVTAHVPVVMVSAAHLRDADRVQGLEGGADAYLTHPIEPSVLLATVRALLRVHAAEAQLREINAQLERRVERRTRELRERNAELERQKTQLEQANEDLEAFAYSASHDLRTPLRHVGSFASLLRRHLQDTDDARARTYLDTIESATRTMGASIEALLAFSRVNREELRFDRVDLTALERAVRADLTATTERPVTWQVGALPTVRGDARLLRLVLENLLGNALKYTGKRDRAVIEVWTETRDGEHHVFVRDNGVGFDARYADKLFGVFQRLHHERDFEGTGVGLATVQRIVRRHGGRVTAEGRVGHGATFGFVLPVDP